jgi:hypothetical protein
MALFAHEPMHAVTVALKNKTVSLRYLIMVRGEI